MTAYRSLALIAALLFMTLAGTAEAAPLTGISSGQAAITPPLATTVDYRPYWHCHGPKHCHGKGNYYRYSPNVPDGSYEPFARGCPYGCGYNNGWNSASRTYYTGRRWYGRHRGRR